MWPCHRRASWTKLTAKRGDVRMFECVYKQDGKHFYFSVATHYSCSVAKYLTDSYYNFLLWKVIQKWLLTLARWGSFHSGPHKMHVWPFSCHAACYPLCLAGCLVNGGIQFAYNGKPHCWTTLPRVWRVQVALLVAHFLSALNETKFMLAKVWVGGGSASHVCLLSIMSVNWWF